MMPPMAAPLTDRIWRTSPPITPSRHRLGWKPILPIGRPGEKLYRNGDRARGIPACAACHGPAGRGNPAAGYPALRAQHSMYLIKQLNAYSSDVRYGKNEHGASFGGETQ